MMRTERSTTAIAIGWTVAAALVCMSACSGRSPESSPHGQAVRSERAVHDMFALTNSYWRDEKLLMDTVSRLTERCLRHRGFEVRLERFRRDLVDGHVVPDLEGRRRWGYGLVLRIPRMSPSLRRLQYDHRFIKAFGGNNDRAIRVVTINGPEGTYPGGCIGEARLSVYGSYHSLLRVGSTWGYARMMSSKVVRDARFHAAERRWRVCMRKRGYSYRTPQEAYDRFYDAHAKDPAKASKPAAMRVERKTAVDDGECAIQVGMPDAVFRIQRDVIAHLSPAMSKDVHRVITERIAAIRRARRLDERLRRHAG